jgi:hypothetical protein
MDDLMSSVVQYRSDVARVVLHNPAILLGFANDTACGWLMWLCAATKVIGDLAYGIVWAIGHDLKSLKELNTCVKATGAQNAIWGPLMCELNVLAGRGVGSVSPYEDIKTRIDTSLFRKIKAAECDLQRLRECVRHVLRSELVAQPKWSDPDNYWTRRWLYTRSGSHPSYSEKRWFGEKLDLPPLPTRREFSEAVKDNLVAYGEPRVDAGFSEKEEHGKTRAIYGCDTVSYFTYDYLLRPIEDAWANKRVLLNPGKELQTELYQKLKTDMNATAYMIDFDDFNSQHTLEAMKMVVEEGTRGAPEEVRAWAINSWDNMYIHWVDEDGLREEKMVGTLPSGHRATTFINTLLNAAYCLYASRDMMKNIVGYHCGDDVIMFSDAQTMSALVDDIEKAPFRINPTKQSIGSAQGEFLRVSFNSERAVGYGARAIASMVSGNWTTDTRLDKKAYIETMLRCTWSMCSRLGDHELGALLVYSLKRAAPELAQYAYRLVTHRMSFNGTPIAEGQGDTISLINAEGGSAMPRPDRLAKTYASDQFLSNHVDVGTMRFAGIELATIKRVLAGASAKPRSYDEEKPMVCEAVRVPLKVSADVNVILGLRERKDNTAGTALESYRMMLTKVDWEKLVFVLTGEDLSNARNSGRREWPVTCDYTLPYSDCMTIRKKVTYPIALMVHYPVRV